MPSTVYSNHTVSAIAAEIKKAWPKVNFAARPYLDAMHTLKSVDENYFADTGKSVVAYFLANANSFRGDVAREIKKELNARIK